MKTIIFYLLCFTFISCTNIDNVSGQIKTADPEGVLKGKVTSQNGSTSIGGAHVFVFDNDNKEISSTFSDAEGNFVLTAPSGSRQIFIQTGTGANFRTDFTVNIVENQTTELPSETTKLKQVAKLGYAEGAFDNVDELIAGMGYQITKLGNDITDINKIAAYDIIYLEVGSSLQNIDPKIFTGLSTFVTNGGNLYASNWAANYLVGGDLYPTDCNMPGGFVPDDKLCVKWRYNTAAPTSDSQILNNRLKQAVGFSAFELVLAKGSDSYVDSYDSNYWETIIKDSDRTHLMKTKNFVDLTSPSIKVGNAANDGWKTICIKNHTVRVPQNKADILIANGAQSGSCSGNAKSGTIYYSLFNADRLNPVGNSEKNIKIIKSCILDF